MFLLLVNLMVSHPYEKDLNTLKTSSGFTTADVLATRTSKLFFIVMDITLNTNDRVVCFRDDLQFSLPKSPETCTASECNGLTMFGPEACYITDSSKRDVTIRYYEDATQTEHILWMHDDGGVPQYSNYNGTRTLLRSFTSKWDQNNPSSLGDAYKTRWSIAPWNPCRTTTVGGTCGFDGSGNPLGSDIYCEESGAQCVQKYDANGAASGDCKKTVAGLDCTTAPRNPLCDNSLVTANCNPTCHDNGSGGCVVTSEFGALPCDAGTSSPALDCHENNAPPPPPQALSPPPGLPPPDPAIAPSPPPGPQVVHFIQDVPKSFGLIVNKSFNITSFSIPKGTRIETADEKFKFNHIYEELSNDEIKKFSIGIGYTITASQNFSLTFEGPPISDSETLQISLKKGRPTSFSPYTNKNITDALNISGMDSDFTAYISNDGNVCEYTSSTKTLQSQGFSDSCIYNKFKRENGYTMLTNKDLVLQF